MIHPISQWSMMSHNLPMNQMMILRKFQIGPANGKSFNPDKSKQAQVVIFSGKTQRVIHPPAIFYNIPLVRSSCQKHLGIYLDGKLNFLIILKKKFQKQTKL